MESGERDPIDPSDRVYNLYMLCMNQITVYMFQLIFILPPMSSILYFVLLCVYSLLPAHLNAHRIVPYCTVLIRVSAGESRRWGCHSKSETAAYYRLSHWPESLARGGSGA